MANPMPEEKEIYERIEKESLAIPVPIWQLLDHHLGNDVYAISLIAAASVVGEEKTPIPVADGEKIIAHCEAIRLFLNRLREVARRG